MLVILAAVMVAATFPNIGFAQQKKLVFWTPLGSKP